MNSVITTPIGRVIVRDERIIENVQAAYEQLYEPRNIEERRIGDITTLGNYKIMTPFGYSCARNYESIFNSENTINKIFKGNVARNIVFTKVF